MMNIVQKSLVYSFICIFSMFLGIFSVSASSYTSTNDLFENNYSNNLIDMAYNQIDNFVNKKFVIFQNDYNYYLIVSDRNDVAVSGNVINLQNATVYQAYRASGSYGSYVYTSYSDSNATVTLNNVGITNTSVSNSVTSKRFIDYRFNYYLPNMLILLIALVFAIFLTKGGGFYVYR